MLKNFLHILFLVSCGFMAAAVMYDHGIDIIHDTKEFIIGSVAISIAATFLGRMIFVRYDEKSDK